MNSNERKANHMISTFQEQNQSLSFDKEKLLIEPYCFIALLLLFLYEHLVLLKVWRLCDSKEKKKKKEEKKEKELEESKKEKEKK